MDSKLDHVDHSSLLPFIPQGAQILILGSFPSKESRKQGFYYAYRRNRFFPVLSSLMKEECPDTIEKRKDFLIWHRIALSDVIYSCDIHGSSDTSICNVVPMDIAKIRKETPSIIQVYTTGKKADELYKRYIGNDNIALPSTSSANAARTREKLVEAYSILLSSLSLN